MADDSIPQFFTPEWVAYVSRLVEDIIFKTEMPIQSHEVDGQTFYCVYDWLNGIVESPVARHLDTWKVITRRFIVNNTPLSKFSHMMMYIHKDGHCLMEYAPSWALYMFGDLYTQMDKESLDARIRARTHDFSDMPSYEIIPMGYVYMVHVDGFPEYKIGYTEDFQRRMGQYKTHMPPSALWVVDYLHEAYYPRDVEKSIHRLLDHYRVKGEWFKLEGIIPLVAKCVLTHLQSAANSYLDKEDAGKRLSVFISDEFNKGNLSIEDIRRIVGMKDENES